MRTLSLLLPVALAITGSCKDSVDRGDKETESPTDDSAVVSAVLTISAERAAPPRW